MFFKEPETERLLLKNISADDREFIYRQFSDANINRFLFDAEPLTDISGADEIIDFFTLPEPRLQHRWILVKKADGASIGTCGFHCWNKRKGICDIGYDLSPGFWGNGYMYEAAREILAFAKNEMEIVQINACIYVKNGNSIKLAEKLGFVWGGQMKDEIFRGEKYPHMLLALK